VTVLLLPALTFLGLLLSPFEPLSAQSLATCPAEEVGGRAPESNQPEGVAGAAIRGLLRDQQDAWNRGDLEGFMRGYWNSPELVFTSGGQVQRGFADVLERYRQTYGSGSARMGCLGFSGLEVHELGADAAWALGRWSLESGGQTMGGVFTLVLRRFPEGWLIVHDHTTSDPAVATARNSGGVRGSTDKDHRTTTPVPEELSP
jgi:ketosteroid isomerase-like protein